jgi:hypothetical protein
MLTVVELRPGSSTVLLIHWEVITVDILKMLELGAKQLVLHVLKEPSGFKEAQLPKGV